jgi:hypothetical protein
MMMPPSATSFCPEASWIQPHATAWATMNVTSAPIWATVTSGVESCPGGVGGASMVVGLDGGGGGPVAGGVGFCGVCGTVSFLVADAEERDNSEDAHLDEEYPALSVGHGFLPRAICR